MSIAECPFCGTMISDDASACPHCRRPTRQSEGSAQGVSGQNAPPPPPSPVPPPPPGFGATFVSQRSTAFTWRKATPYVVVSFVVLLIFLLLLLMRGGGRGGSGGELAGRGGGVGTDVGAGSGGGDGTGSGAGGTASPQNSAPGAQGEEEPAEADATDESDSIDQAGPVFAERTSPPTPAEGGAGGGTAGGRGGGGRPLGTGDVSFRIYWTPRSHDIDLHVTDPNGHHLWFKAAGCPCHGVLDRDDRIGGGPENIFWPDGRGPRGQYTYFAHYFEGTGEKQVVLQVRKKGEIVEEQTVVLRRVGETSAKFTYRQ